VYIKYGEGHSNFQIFGLTRYDDNQTINNYKQTFGVSHPCAGDEGYAGNAIDVIIDGQAFYGTPTYVVICPDYKVHFDICFPPQMSCFDSYIQNCNESLTADFQADNNQICAGATVQFEDNSQGNILMWEWHFEGGIPEFSNDMNPVVTYDEAGSWDVSLIVSNDLYSDTLNFADFVEVFANPDVTLQPFDEVCENNPPFMLIGGFPEGGEYSGPGVEDGWFYPEIAGVGEHLISYSYEDDNGCSGTAEENLVVEMCTSVTEIRNLDLDIYPTPTTGELFIRPYFSGNTEIQLVDLTGMKVYETSSFVQAGEPLKLDIRHLSSGFYLLRVSNGEDSFSSKVVLTPGQ